MQTLFDLDKKEIIEPEIGEIVRMEGFEAECQKWNQMDGSHCQECFFYPFPASVCCDLIKCYGNERQDRTFVNFKQIYK